MEKTETLVSEQTTEQSPESPQPSEGAATTEKAQKDWAKVVLFSLLGLFILIGAVCGGYWLASRNAKLKTQIAKPRPAVTTPSPATEQPTPTPVTEDETTEWKVFSGSDFDITFKYPSNWTVETGYAQDGEFDFECSYLDNWLKDMSSCSGTHKSPSVEVRPPHGTKGQGLILWGPTSGLGGYCPDCEIINKSVVIDGVSYTIPVKIYPSGRYSTFPDGGGVIAVSGDSSIWSQIGIEFDVTNESDYEIVLRILSTVKPN